MMTSKCAGCDQHNAVIYNYEDMYCHDCYNEKKEIEDDWFLSGKSYEEYYMEEKSNEESIETPKIIVQGGMVVEVTGLDKYEIIDLDIEETDSGEV
jgi:hypothetical protein